MTFGACLWECIFLIQAIMSWSLNDVDTTSTCDRFDGLFVITRSISVDDVLVIRVDFWTICFKPCWLITLLNSVLSRCFPRVSMFPSTSSRENKTHYFPLDHTLSVFCMCGFCVWQQICAISCDLFTSVQHFHQYILDWPPLKFTAKCLSETQEYATDHTCWSCFQISCIKYVIFTSPKYFGLCFTNDSSTYSH